MGSNVNRAKRMNSTNRAQIQMYITDNLSRTEIPESLQLTQSGISCQLKRRCKKGVYDAYLAE